MLSLLEMVGLRVVAVYHVPTGAVTEIPVMSKAARLRTWWAVPAVVALVGSLLIGPTDPAAGIDGVADHKANYSACAGPAAESAGFPDVVGSFAEDAVNCLAHYEITLGNSQGLFAPNDIVPRWQMALFLARAAVPAGVVVPPAVDQGFTDLDRMGDKTREAINQLAALGVMLSLPGTSETAFSPYGEITRQEMALMLSRFLEVAPVGPGGANIRTIVPDDDVFTDLGPVTITAHRAIRKIYELGVTQGTTATTFSPNRHVNRAQMAAFITRMLAHTNARPAGLTAQLAITDIFKNSDIHVSVSVRDPDRLPVDGREVDVFVGTDPAKAFDDDGVCTDHVSPALGTGACVIETSDKTTDSSGNLEADIEVGNADRLHIWLWTGVRRATFDEDGTDFEVIEVTTRSPATALEVSDDMPFGATKVRFGDWVTFTFRLVDEDGDPVPKPGVRFTVAVERSRDSSRLLERSTTVEETGPEGTARLTYLYIDPSDDPGDVARLGLDITSSADLEVIDKTTIEIVDDDDRSSDPYLHWEDNPSEPTTLDLSVPREYRLASAEGNGAGTTVRALLTDQYGGPVAGEQIVFISSDRAGVPYGVSRTTNPQGVATLGYQRDSSDTIAERITGRFGSLVATARQYWAAHASSGADGSGEVRVVETDNNRLVVVASNDVLILEYDGNDRFHVGTLPVSISTFEENLTVGDRLAYDITNPAEATANSFTLTNR